MKTVLAIVSERSSYLLGLNIVSLNGVGVRVNASPIPSPIERTDSQVIYAGRKSGGAQVKGSLSWPLQVRQGLVKIAERGAERCHLIIQLRGSFQHPVP